MFAYSSTAGLYQPRSNTLSAWQSAAATVTEAALLSSYWVDFKVRKLRRHLKH